MSEQGELEARIAADPDDDAAYAVYADLLQRAGDPRGELIALMLAREAEIARKLERSPVATAVDRHLKKLAAQLRGKLSMPPAQSLGWRRGFVHRLTLAPADSAQLPALLAHPSSRFVRELVAICDSLDATYAVVDAVAERRPPLHELELTSRSPRGQVELLDLATLWPAIPAIRRLALVARAFDLGAVHAPHTQRLRLLAERLSSANLRALAAAPWPALERLELRFAGASEPSSATLADVQHLLRHALPALTHLKLRGCEHAGEALVSLAGTALGRRLVVIDLSHSLVEPAEIRALAGHRDSFPALRELWLPTVAHAHAQPLLAGIATHLISDARAPRDTFEETVGR